jgi:hypothetical protein
MTAKKKKAPRRQYLHPETGEKLPSVTEIIGQLDKSGPLIPWAARIAAEATAAALLDDGMLREAAIDVGKKAPNKRRDHAADRGTLAHALVEANYTGEPADVEGVDPVELEAAQRCAARAVAAIDAAGYDVVHAELADVAWTWPDHWFGGTMDLVLCERATGDLILGDLKTGKNIYAEVPIQLAAYSHILQKAKGQTALRGVVVHAPAFDDDAPVRFHHVSEEHMAAGFEVFDRLLLLHNIRKDFAEHKMTTTEAPGV